MLTALTLYLAVYASDTDSRPAIVVCEAFDAPTAIDVEACPGELLTAEDDASFAVCEVTL